MSTNNKKLKSSQLKNAIVKQLYFARGLSCAERNELFDKCIPVVSKAVNELTTEGMVIEQGRAASSGGRRPQTYSLKPYIMRILAVATNQLSTRMQLFDFINNPVAEHLNVAPELLDNHDTLSSLAYLINP